MFRNFRLLAALAMFVSIVASTANANEKPSRLLVLGDSLSAAYGLETPEQGWVALLEQALAPDIEVINASISGDTTTGGLARLPKLLTKFQPQQVLIELGGNDGLRGQSIASLRKNLQAMIELAQSAGAEVLLMEIQIPPNYGRRYTEKFTGVYSALAEQTGATLVPFFLRDLALQDGMMQADGIHPTAKAQTAMRDAVLPFVRRLNNRSDNPPTAVHSADPGTR